MSIASEPRRPMTMFVPDSEGHEVANRRLLQTLNDVWNKQVPILGREYVRMADSVSPAELKSWIDRDLVPKAAAIWGEQIYDYQMQLWGASPPDRRVGPKEPGTRYSCEHFIQSIFLYASNSLARR